MARIEWVRTRLENWARWCAQQGNSGLGYPTQTAFSRLGGKGTRSDVAIPILALEAAETDQAVKALRWTQPHLYKMLTLLYAQGLPRHQVAIKMGRAESTVKRQLEEADHAIARWLQERKAQADERRAAALK